MSARGGSPTDGGDSDTVAALMAKKESFSDAYESGDPRLYYRRYAPTRLSVAEYPAALVRRIAELGIARGPVIDLGCGYGTLGALLRTDLDIEAVYASYLAGSELRLPLDKSYTPSIIGIDRAGAALAAARRAHLVDGAYQLDLNSPELGNCDFGAEAIAVCTAALGYVRPAALMRAIVKMRPRLAVVTCVTWLAEEFGRAAREQPYPVMRLNRQPLFQRWATAEETAQMGDALIAGAHRADCFLIGEETAFATALAETVERLQAERGASAWLAAGRRDGCELRLPSESAPG